MVVQRLLTLLLASTCVSLAAQEAGRKALAAPSFEEAPCPFTADATVVEQVRCGYVHVPENRSSPERRRLRLAVAIIKSLSADPRPDPIVVIGGGPGDAMLARAAGYVANGTMNAVRADRDVILYDQRGVGFSEPKFCPEVSAELASVDRGDSPAANRTRQRQLLARCGEYMRAAGYDLSQYNSAVSAHDLQDLRRALGYEQWNVRAASYGTRLALVSMRVAPQGIRSAVLDGPWSPNRAAWFNRPADFVDILERLSASCAAQPACNKAFPDVERTFWRAVDEYERAPKVRQITLPNGTAATLTVTGPIIAGSVAMMLERRMYPMVPLAIAAMGSGNDAVLNLLQKVLASRPNADDTPPAGWGLHYTVNCFEEAPLNTVELRQRMRSAHPAVLTDSGIFPDPSVCEGLHQYRATPEHSVLVESQIPTLIFTGELDLQTHRSNGETVARSLKNSQLVEIPGAGHVQSWRHECTRAMMRDFYNAPLRPVDVKCLKSIPPLRFVTDYSGIAK